MTKALQRIMTLENELKILDSYIDSLKLYHEDEITSLEIELNERNEEILDLEYELYIEKTRGSSHKFFWFTANRIPIDADVSYSNTEDTLYGYKQPPQYKVIEHHDLRFVTHSTLDDLIEQFR